MTREELYRWLWQPGHMSYSAFVTALDTQDQFLSVHGYYMLPGRDVLVQKRAQTVPFVAQKMAIAKKATKKMRWIPFVRAVFLCNTVASGGVSEESDIDVFIIVRKGRMWLTRFLVTFIVGLFGLRRNKRQVANRICLSFYVTDDNLDLSYVALASPDIYLMYWVYQLVPLYDPEAVLDDIHHNNSWIQKYIPHGAREYQLVDQYRTENMPIQKHVKRFFEQVWGGSYGTWLEQQAKGVQQQKMKWNTDSVQEKNNTHVVVSDKMLKFHENDRREKYRDAWQASVSSLSSCI